jgi:hypothetical protein
MAGAEGGIGSRPDSPTERLQRLQLFIAELNGRGFTDRHPDVISTREQIAILQDELATSADLRQLDQEIASPQSQLASNEAERASLRAASSERELERLREQADAIEDSLAVTPRVEEQLVLLERERETLRTSYREFSAKRLDAAVTADMERRQKGQQFRLLDSAVAPPHPSSPDRPLIVFVGLLLGLALGAALAVLLEAVDRSFHDVRSTQVRLGLPVLASVPAILLESDRWARRRKRILAATLVAGISGAILMGAGASYWLVNGPPGFVGALLSGGDDAEAAAPEGEGSG